MFGMLTRSGARAFSTTDWKVFHDVARQRFMVSECGKPAAVLTYRGRGQCMTLIHTCVPACYKGKGIGTLLTKYALNFAKEHQLQVTIQCHFIADYYIKNISTYSGMKVKFQVD